MKKNYLLFLFCFISYFANAQEPFVTTWHIGSNLNITIPIVGDDYTIDFGDGTVLNNQSGSVTHYYDTTGIYTVSVSGNFTGIYFGPSSNGTAYRLKTVEQWGDVQWASMYEAFYGCYDLTITATDTPDLSQVTNMSRMFHGAILVNSSFNDWDVSNVTNMSGMFSGAESFNQPLNNWDVSNVTTMESMFYNAESFNQPLDSWNVSNVTNMRFMFSYTESFNQPIGNWDVSGVTSMEGVFRSAASFNQPLNDWDTSNVNNMAEMFASAISFNQSLNDWDVSNVTKMYGMFSSAASFNQPLNDWDVSNVEEMTGMFNSATSFNQPLNDWNVSNVEEMNGMFSSATSFDQPLNDWDVSSVITMSNMFRNTSAFNQDLSAWSYNENISFGGGFFVRYSGLDIDNYDALLLRFAQLGLHNKTLESKGLEYCNSVGVRSYLINQLGWDISEDTLAEACEVNTLFGNVLYDEENNGCDTNDIPVNFLVSSTGGDETYGSFSMSNNQGAYTLHLFEGSYNIMLLNLPDYFAVNPANPTVVFTGSGSEQELNFCLTATQVIEDLNITLLPIDDARPGFESEYQMIIENMGTQTVNPVVSVTFNETLQTFVTATPEATSTTGNQLTFTIENLQPFGSSVINFTMQTFEPPTVNGGEIAEFTAIVTPDANDINPDDNTFTLEQEIVNSFDPNDKRVVQGEEIFIEQASEYLDYIIRFQNTGTASAITVRIEDTLSENLDWTTLKPISASHDYTVQITGGNQVEFIFNNINLPHEAADEPGSHGFIAYKIKPIEGLEIGDVINGNTAGIYFDYNLPIITNATTTEIVEVLNTNDLVLNNQITVYPNPVNNILHIETKSGVQLEGVKIYNLQGIQLMNLNQDFENINTESLSSGIYLLSIQTNKGSAEYKLIKN